jgi:hypothetical protein
MKVFFGYRSKCITCIEVKNRRHYLGMNNTRRPIKVDGVFFDFLTLIVSETHIHFAYKREKFASRYWRKNMGAAKDR